MRDKINNQWKNLTLIKWENIQNTNNLWAEVYGYKDSNGENAYHELAILAISFLVLPNSNAEGERLFSQMNLIKSKLRYKMRLPMLNAILSVRSGMRREGRCCDTYEINKNVLKKLNILKPTLAV